MKQATKLLALLLAVCAQSVLAADGEGRKFGIGAQGGTTGAGLVFAAPLTNTLRFRGSYNFFQYDTDFDDTDVTYDADFNKDSLGLMMDWHPGGGGFRVSAGAFVHSDNTVSVLAQPSAAATYTINDNVYDASNIGSVAGEVSFGKTTPYLGIGWGNATGKAGFTMMFDVGVQFQDSPDVALVAFNCNLTAALCTQLNSDLQAEVVELERDAEDFDLWPVVNLGLIYRF